MSTKMLRYLVLAGCLSLAAWPPAVAAPVTDNLVPIFSGPGSKHCDNDPEGGDGKVTCKTDNATVTWYMDSGGTYELEEPDRVAVRAAMNNEFEPTHLDTVYDTTPTFSGTAETDIVYQEGSDKLDDAVDGVTWCENAVDSSTTDWRCDQQYVRIRGNGHYTPGLVCHETGHAIGLVHGPSGNPSLPKGDNRLGCMTDPVETSDLGSNNTQNINAEWDAP